MRTRRAKRQQVEYGDWQTPDALAVEVVSLLLDTGVSPKSIVEPTCGEGSFLAAASDAWPEAALRGWDVNPSYASAAQARVAGRAQVGVADFFVTKWEKVLADLAEPLLIIGNPPWVTSSELGTLESANLPEKKNFKGYAGLDAITGKANFDVSEWMILRLLNALKERSFQLSMLCKALVGRRIMEHVARHGLRMGGALYDIDAKGHFDASVEAVLLSVWSEPKRTASAAVRWSHFSSLADGRPATVLGYINGTLTPDVERFERSAHFEGTCEPEWRSGLKHDCSRVMEFTIREGETVSQAAGAVDLEPDYLYPLMKGSDVANRRWPPTRAVLVPQQRLGEDTGRIKPVAPRTWEYLLEHQEALDARKSTIYKGQPRFAVFGVGEYTFAPWKVAVAGLYKRLEFFLVGPHEGRTVVFDDTCYFLPFDTEEAARQALTALKSPEARDFFQARIFWDDKRPINKKVLQALDLRRLQHHLGLLEGPRPAEQVLLFGEGVPADYGVVVG